jgi:hypothetical protein
MQEPKNWYGPGANFIRAVPKIERSVNGALVSRMTYIDLDIRECAEEAAFTLF